MVEGFNNKLFSGRFGIQTGVSELKPFFLHGLPKGKSLSLLHLVARLSQETFAFFGPG